ncbi:prolyl oligopeptidase family serine peptidase [Herbihabitans rhizosphaerae]|nr:prolyl oligopeptidase family serine peptidase [Herbihabitans rhizosphaerae]
MKRTMTAIAVGVVTVTGAVPASAAQPETTRPMTVRDVAEIRRIPHTAITADGRRAAFTVTEPSTVDNTVTSRLMVVDTDAPDRPRTVATVRGRLERIAEISWTPDSHAITYVAPVDGAGEVWTVPAFGGTPRKLFSSPVPAVPVGGQRLPFFNAVIPPHLSKVLHHSWSPDGRAVAFTAPRLIGTAPRTGGVVYDSATMGIQSYVEGQYGARPRHEVWAADPLTGQTKHLADLDLTAVDGWGPEQAWSADGKRIELNYYGRAWTVDVTTGQLSTVDPKDLTAPRWREQLPQVPGQRGVCSAESVSADGDRGVCVREESGVPPRLAVVDKPTASVRDGYDPNPWFRGVTFLSPVRQEWTNAYGKKATGYVITPPECGDGKRCPAVVITHGHGAGERFMSPWFEWDAASQVLAQRGYVVLLVNDSTGVFPQPGKDWEETKRNLGLDAVATMRAAVKAGVDSGLLDPARVGITGYSRGAEIAELAVAHTDTFSAATMGDGGGGTAGYWILGAVGPPKQILDGAFGGSPVDPAAEQRWREFAPDLNAHKVKAPLLFQMAEGNSVANTELYSYVRARTTPAELVTFPGENHLLQQPANRAAAMNRNLQWFDYWLLDRRSDDPSTVDQYARWDAMRAAWRR